VHILDPAQVVIWGTGLVAVDAPVRPNLSHVLVRADTMAVDIAVLQVHLAQVFIRAMQVTIDLAAIQFHAAHVLVWAGAMTIDLAVLRIDPAQVLIEGARPVAICFSHSLVSFHYTT
jgi:hypothetical protein